MGNVIGIVAEYNPFHNGHARLIEQTRARLGADCPVVCVMSGDFVQRGSPAVYSKFARAEAAARCGADLVLELPLHVLYYTPSPEMQEVFSWITFRTSLKACFLPEPLPASLPF